MHKTAVRLSVVVVSALVSVSLAVVFPVRVWLDALTGLVHLGGDSTCNLGEDWVRLWDRDLSPIR